MELLINIFNAMGIDYYHTPAPKNAALPYIAYIDYTESYFKADDRIDDTVKHIQVDYYTKTEFDPNKDKIQGTLDAAGIVFDYQHMYEDDEKIYHHIFDCEVVK